MPRHLAPHAQRWAWSLRGSDAPTPSAAAGASGPPAALDDVAPSNQPSERSGSRGQGRVSSTLSVAALAAAAAADARDLLGSVGRVRGRIGVGGQGLTQGRGWG